MKIEQGGYKLSDDEIIELNCKQGFENIACIHKMYVVTELEGFLKGESPPSIQTIFLRCGHTQGSKNGTSAYLGKNNTLWNYYF